MVEADKTRSAVFAFGKNWRKFLESLNEKKIAGATNALRSFLGLESLQGFSFLDIGSGSGLSSLAAIQLGAQKVLSFDIDPQCVLCAQTLKDRYCPEAEHWTIKKGSILDPIFIKEMGEWDIVYSWGVLHHTGYMWQSFAHLPPLVKKGGTLALAVYNDQGWKSRYWLWVKKKYNQNVWFRGGMIIAHFPFLVGFPLVKRVILGRSWRERDRGMDFWRDYLDWLGGYPFETARTADVVGFFQKKGFRLNSIKTVGKKLGCNEFLFVKEEESLPGIF